MQHVFKLPPSDAFTDNLGDCQQQSSDQKFAQRVQRGVDRDQADGEESNAVHYTKLRVRSV